MVWDLRVHKVSRILTQNIHQKRFGDNIFSTYKIGTLLVLSLAWPVLYLFTKKPNCLYFVIIFECLSFFANIPCSLQAKVPRHMTYLHARSQKENCNRFPEKIGVSGRKIKVLNLAVGKESTCKTYLIFSVLFYMVCKHVVYFLSCMSPLYFIALRLLPRVRKMHIKLHNRFKCTEFRDTRRRNDLLLANLSPYILF